MKKNGGGNGGMDPQAHINPIDLAKLSDEEAESILREWRLRDSQWALAAHKAAIEVVKSGLSLWALAAGIALLCGARWSLLWCSVAVVAALATGAGGVSWHLEKRFGVKVTKEGVVIRTEAVANDG